LKINEVIIVDEHDQPLGVMEKMAAHQAGTLHRAFSVFIFDKKGRLLLQQRAASKYHGALLWSNTCCSHPVPGEETKAAAQRRLKEELGFNAPVEKIFDFVYKASVENGLTEHEFDHVFAGEYEGEIKPDPAEVADYKFADITEIKKELTQNPSVYTSWFRIVFPRIEEWKAHPRTHPNPSRGEGL
jgi:isopentenyl-diphosphate Delta-isomerase